MGDRPGFFGPVLTAQHLDRQVQLAFVAYQSMDSHVGRYQVSVTADALQASANVITAAGGDGLVEFIDGLADEFKGWLGARSWRSLENQLSIDATWESGGHVLLRFHLTPSFDDKWTLTVDVVLEAGEEMQSLSAGLRGFFGN